VSAKTSIDFEKLVATMTTKKKWAIRVLALLLGLLLSELILSVACLVSPRVNYFLSPPWSRVILSDDELGHRMSPYYPGNDRWGFRNKGVPESCEMLAIGDSITYGYAASPEKSWPRQLEQMSGQSMYNCSCGGYGPCQYLVLLEKGLALKPKTVLLGLYLGNDLFDAYAAVYVQNRFPQYRTRDEAVLKALAEADGVVSSVDLLELGGGERDVGGATAPTSLPRRLLHKSSLYALAREVRWCLVSGEYASIRREGDLTQDRFEVAALRPGRLSFDAEPKLRTVFKTPALGLWVFNLDDPRLREGQRITECVLAAMQAKLQSLATRFVVVILPTKEAAYREVVENSGASMPAAYFSMLDKEEQLYSAMEQYLRAQQIEFVQCLPSLRAALTKGEKLYPESDDAHFNSAGYRVIADTVLVFLNAGK
jgi:hypothetical protein